MNQSSFLYDAIMYIMCLSTLCTVHTYAALLKILLSSMIAGVVETLVRMVDILLAMTVIIQVFCATYYI